MSFAILHKQHARYTKPKLVSKYTNIPTIKIFSKTQSSHLALRLSNEQIVCHAKAHSLVSVVQCNLPIHDLLIHDPRRFTVLYLFLENF